MLCDAAARFFPPIAEVTRQDVSGTAPLLKKRGICCVFLRRGVAQQGIHARD